MLYRLSSVGLDFRPTPFPAPGLERVMGIEPTPSAWKAEVLPLNYTRITGRSQPAEARVSRSTDVVEGVGFEPTKA